ncbi:MAG: DUF4367 domain-containing protein [Acutalibacteraceae bacterium]
MISDKDFIKYIRSKNSELTTEDWERIMNEELKKDVSEIDADLVEYCLSQINISESKDVSRKEKSKSENNTSKLFLMKKSKIVILVAILLIVIGFVNVSAVLKPNFANELIELYNNHIRIHFEQNSDTATDYALLETDLAQKLAENDISPVLLPEGLFADGTDITRVDCSKGTNHTEANIIFNINGYKGFMQIIKFSDKSFLTKQDYLMDGQRVETVVCSGITVYVVEQNGVGTVSYQDGLTKYYIYTPLSFEEAIEFAKTIE